MRMNNRVVATICIYVRNYILKYILYPQYRTNFLISLTINFEGEGGFIGQK